MLFQYRYTRDIVLTRKLQKVLFSKSEGILI